MQENRYFGIWFLENSQKIQKIRTQKAIFFLLKDAPSQPFSSLEK